MTFYFRRLVGQSINSLQTLAFEIGKTGFTALRAMVCNAPPNG
jgi:hypothetical protein